MALLKRKASTKPSSLPKKVRVKKGDTVMVITGKDKGKTGAVKSVNRDRGTLTVEGLNIKKKAIRPNPMMGQRGGHAEIEAPINLSNVMLYDLKNNQATRVKMETLKDGKRVRVAVKSGEQLD